MLVTKTAINVIGEIAKKGYLIINKNCKSDLQNSESLFYLKIFFSKILLTQKKSNCYIGTATGNGFENGGFAMRKAKKCNTGKKKFVVVWLALVVLFLGSFIRPVDVQATKVKLNKSAVTIYRGASTSLKVSGSKKKVKWSSSKKSVASVSASGKVTGKKGGSAYICAKVGKRTLKCKVTVKEPNKSKRLNLAKKEAKKIVKKYVAADLNAKERAFVLFRYLTEHCSWQLNQSSEAYQKNYGNEAYAALVMKKAACSGYAKAYTLLCEAANVPVRHVNAGSWTHQWNEVKVNGKWIKVDAYGGTFADTTGIRKSLRTSSEDQEQLVFHFTIER